MKQKIKSGFRYFTRSPVHSLINLFGLSIGLACCLLIGMFVQYEFSYDSFFPNSKNIYRLSPDFFETSNRRERHPASNVAPFVPFVAQNDIEGIREIARIGGMHALVARDDTFYYEDGFRWADPEIFRIFQLEWIHGDATTALSQPESVAISSSASRRYFGEENPIGQTLLLENTWPMTVTAVFEDIPENSHLFVDLIVPMETAWQMLDFDYGNNWSYTNFHSYVLLDGEAEIGNVVERIEGAIAGAAQSTIPDFWEISPESFSLTPYQIADIHLSSDRILEFKRSGNMAFVFGFSAIAGCLLLIACFNFMNSSTASAMRRSKEVGMRKILGANRIHLIAQFMLETSLIVVFAMCVALALTEVLRPAFSALIERPLTFSLLLLPELIAFSIIVMLLTTLVAGSYPAIHLANFQPTNTIRAGSRGAGRNTLIRNFLVAIQFVLAISLIIITAVINLQMRYVSNTELGFNRENVLVLWGTHRDGLGNQWEVFEQELLQHPNITHVAKADMYPGSVANRRIRVEGSPLNAMNIQVKEVGFGFLEMYDINIVAGRSFNEQISSDVFYPPTDDPDDNPLTGSYILNATAVRELGFTPDEVLGKQLDVDFSASFSRTVSGPVIGVAEDIYIQSLRREIQPLVYFVPALYWGETPRLNIASVKLSGNNTEDTVNFVRDRWNELIPEMPFNSHFLESDFELLYQDEERQSQLFTLFAVLTIVIACLGLYGLVSFAIQNRRKEIGVRKVVGSSAWNILLLLSGEFSRLVLLANLIAWPLAYMVVSRWLQIFAYHIDLTPLVFLGGGAVALCIAWVTVCSTAIRAAFENPVLALRYE